MARPFRQYPGRVHAGRVPGRWRRLGLRHQHARLAAIHITHARRAGRLNASGQPEFDYASARHDADPMIGIRSVRPHVLQRVARHGMEWVSLAILCRTSRCTGRREKHRRRWASKRSRPFLAPIWRQGRCLRYSRLGLINPFGNIPCHFCTFDGAGGHADPCPCSIFQGRSRS